MCHTQVMLSDGRARQVADGRGQDFRKFVAERMQRPTFDVVVELPGLREDAYVRVVLDVAKAVDAVLEGRAYECQERFLCRDGDDMTLLMENLRC